MRRFSKADARPQHARASRRRRRSNLGEDDEIQIEDAANVPIFRKGLNVDMLASLDLDALAQRAGVPKLRCGGLSERNGGLRPAPWRKYEPQLCPRRGSRLARWFCSWRPMG